MTCPSVQEILVNLARTTIPDELAIVDRGNASIDLACWIAEDNIPRIMTHGIVVEITSEAGFTAGRYSGTEQRNQWICELSMRLYLPQDMPNPNRYLQDIQWLEDNGMVIPQPIANMQNAAAKLMVAIKKAREVQSVAEAPPLARDIQGGQRRLALRLIRVRFNPEGSLDLDA